MTQFSMEVEEGDEGSVAGSLVAEMSQLGKCVARNVSCAPLSCTVCPASSTIYNIQVCGVLYIAVTQEMSGTLSVCRVCRENFSKPEELEQHMQSHLEKNMYGRCLCVCVCVCVCVFVSCALGFVSCASTKKNKGNSNYLVTGVFFQREGIGRLQKRTQVFYCILQEEANK